MGVDLNTVNPNALIMVIGGVVLDPTKAPPNWPYPGNRFYCLKPVGLNHWRGRNGNYTAEIVRVVDEWGYVGRSVFPLNERVFFVGADAAGPLNSVENTLEFIDGYDHGFCSVSDPAAVPLSPTSSFTSMANAMSIDLNESLRVDPFVKAERETVYRYADKKDATNVKILLDRDYVP